MISRATSSRRRRYRPRSRFVAGFQQRRCPQPSLPVPFYGPAQRHGNRKAIKQTGNRIEVTHFANLQDACRRKQPSSSRVAACSVGIGPHGVRPRALGHRSILADPATLKCGTASSHGKMREAFRPFAPAFPSSRFQTGSKSPRGMITVHDA